MQKLSILLLILFIVFSQNKCAYRVMADGWPVKLKDGENQPFMIQNYFSCPEYNGRLGCCNQNNDKQQKGSYIQLDSVFGFAGSGCDHCSINLKRFWCEYACSPNQADFINITNQNTSIPDPQSPDKNLSVQLLTVTVEAQTACDLYNSCKRIAFVTSVSAMGSPAGFLTFQGHNACDDALQYIDVDFSYNKSKALTFSNQFEFPEQKKLDTCDTKVNTKTWHGFKFNQNCKCNTCEQACDSSSGFIYTQSSVFQGFNWILVGGTYLLFGAIAAGITWRRKKNQIKSKEN